MESLIKELPRVIPLQDQVAPFGMSVDGEIEYLQSQNANLIKTIALALSARHQEDALDEP